MPDTELMRAIERLSSEQNQHVKDATKRHGELTTQMAGVAGDVKAMGVQVDQLEKRLEKEENITTATGTHALVRAESRGDGAKRATTESGRHWATTAIALVLAAIAIVDIALKLKGQP